MDQVPPITTPEPIAPLPQKPSPLLPILLTFFITSTLLIGGYFSYRYFSTVKTTPIPLPSPTPLSSPTTITETQSNFKQPTPPAGWKTYTNNVRKYSISYPKEWFADTSLAETTLEDPSGASLVLSRENYRLTINWPNPLVPQECVFDDQNKTIETQQAICSGDFVSFGNQMRRLRNPILHQDTTSNTWTIYSYKTPNSYVSNPPTYYSAPYKYDPSIITEMDQILATFNPATDQPHDTPSSKWTIYTIDDLNLSFKLPPQLSQFGALNPSSSLSETGSESCWTFPVTKSMFQFQVYAGGGSCSTNHFGLAATTIDHSAGRSGGFADIKEFEVPKNIPSSKISSFTNPQGVKIIRITGGEYPKEPNSEWEGSMDYFGDLGPKTVGALIQYSAPNYEVITASMDLTQELTIDIFDQILSTVKFAN